MTISVRAIEAVISGLGSSGYSADVLLDKCGIDRNCLNEPKLRLPADVFVELAKEIICATQDEGLCLFPRPIKSGAFLAAARLAIGARRLGSAMRRVADIYNLLDFGVRVELMNDVPNIRLSLISECSDRIKNNVIYEIYLLAFHRFFSWLAGNAIALESVALARMESAEESDYARIFHNVSVISNSKENCLIFSASYLDLPIVRGEEEFKEFIHQHAGYLFVPARIGDQFIIRMKARVAASLELLGRPPTLEELALELGLTSRGIFRQLKTRGITYRQLISLVRRDISIRHVASATMSIEDISRSAGYSELSAFSRAFKEWTGVPPSEYRQRIGGVCRNRAGRLGRSAPSIDNRGQEMEATL